MDDEELAARMRAADPARGPAPADSWIDDLVEATMASGTTETSPGTSTEPRTRLGAGGSRGGGGRGRRGRDLGTDC